MTTHHRNLASAVLTLALAACEVTNPGPVADQFLDLPEAHQALVNGAAARLSGGLGYTAMTGGFAAREIFPTGQTNLGQSLLLQAGSLQPVDVSTHWGQIQQARWVAEDAIRRFKTLPAAKVTANVFAEAYLWTGFSNRALGENMCDAVFDGGPRQANVEYFKRAEAAFGEAIARGSGDFKTAGYAGRASVRIFLKDWAGAAADAQQVPIGFVYRVNGDPTNPDTRNTIAHANGNNPYRIYSGIQTWFYDYFNQSGDPRLAFFFDARYPNGVQNLPGYGQVAWWQTGKYPLNQTPIRVSTGREMVLVRAEAALTNNDMTSAMTLINSLRSTIISSKTGKALDPWSATTIADAWTALKRERGIELWLEGRRLGDIRRWEESRTPGTLDWPSWESLAALFRDNKPSRCFPIPETELNTNSNLR